MQLAGRSIHVAHTPLAASGSTSSHQQEHRRDHGDATQRNSAETESRGGRVRVIVPHRSARRRPSRREFAGTSYVDVRHASEVGSEASPFRRIPGADAAVAAFRPAGGAAAPIFWGSSPNAILRRGSGAPWFGKGDFARMWRPDRATPPRASCRETGRQSGQTDPR